MCNDVLFAFPFWQKATSHSRLLLMKIFKVDKKQIAMFPGPKAVQTQENDLIAGIAFEKIISYSKFFLRNRYRVHHFDEDCIWDFRR